MGKLKLGRDIRDLIRIVEPSEQIVKPRLEKFVMRHGNKPFSPEVANWVRDQLIAVPRQRVRSFAGSASGSCHRAQIMQFVGIPQPGIIDEQLQQIYNDGHWRHLRLQAQLIEAGIIHKDAMEFPLPWPAMRSMGTADGNGIVPYDHLREDWRGKCFGLEIKGANSFVAQKMINPNKYLHQVHRYFLSGGFDLFVILVEDKNTQGLKEWVIEPDPVMMQAQRDELEALNRYVENKYLPPPLPECVKPTGDTFRKCPFGTTKHGPCATMGAGKIINDPKKWE